MISSILCTWTTTVVSVWPPSSQLCCICEDTNTTGSTRTCGGSSGVLFQVVDVPLVTPPNSKASLSNRGSRTQRYASCSHLQQCQSGFNTALAPIMILPPSAAGFERHRQDTPAAGAVVEYTWMICYQTSSTNLLVVPSVFRVRLGTASINHVHIPGIPVVIVLHPLLLLYCFHRLFLRGLLLAFQASRHKNTQLLVNRTGSSPFTVNFIYALYVEFSVCRT